METMEVRGDVGCRECLSKTFVKIVRIGVERQEKS